MYLDLWGSATYGKELKPCVLWQSSAACRYPSNQVNCDPSSDSPTKCDRFFPQRWNTTPRRYFPLRQGEQHAAILGGIDLHRRGLDAEDPLYGGCAEDGWEMPGRFRYGTQ